MGAFVPTPGEIAQALDAVGKLVDLIKSPQKANKLAKWAELLSRIPDATDESAVEALAKDRMEFLHNLMQDCGFTPWYEWRVGITIPKDLLCDLGDLLIGGPVEGSAGGWLQGLAKMFTSGGKLPNEKEAWAVAVAYGKDEDIIQALKNIVAGSGRTRYYDKNDVGVVVDKSLIADAGMWLLNSR